MDNQTREAFNRIYRRRDHDYYRKQCAQELVLPVEFSRVLAASAYEVVEFYKASTCWPCRKWMFKFPPVSNDNFECGFDTILVVSKIIPAFYIQHEFGVDNRAEDKIMPTLDGYSGRAYTKAQFNLDEEVDDIFQKNDYTRLTIAMISEAVCDLSFDEGVTIFGPQVTVEHVLFYDFLGICEHVD